MRRAAIALGRTAHRRCARAAGLANQRAGGFRGSSYLADQIRDTVAETVATVGTDHICNGHSRADLVDHPTIDVSDDFVYDIDLSRLPSGDLAARWHGLRSAPDPFHMVKGDISTLSDGINALLGTDHPVLTAAAKYFFEVDGGKKVRPTMVLLMSYACNTHADTLRKEQQKQQQQMRSAGAMAAPLPAAAAAAVVAPVLDDFDLACQRRLAEITEMIHTASLFHDDVIDEADTRRGVPSVNKVFGNKLAILAGDFLLARASVSLARLRSIEVVELLSTVIEHLVKGEVLQMRPVVNGASAFEYYVRKNYYKTGSLMANSCKAAAILGRHGPEVQDIAHEYGKRVGLAFQLVDDVLDFEGNDFTLGKPALNDLKQGLATAPVLLAAEEAPHLRELINRKFSMPGDVDEVLRAVRASGGIQRTKDIARVQAELATEAVLRLTPSPERDALVTLTYKIINRKH